MIPLLYDPQDVCDAVVYSNSPEKDIAEVLNGFRASLKTRQENMGLEGQPTILGVAEKLDFATASWLHAIALASALVVEPEDPNATPNPETGEEAWRMTATRQHGRAEGFLRALRCLVGVVEAASNAGVRLEPTHGVVEHARSLLAEEPPECGECTNCGHILTESDLQDTGNPNNPTPDYVGRTCREWRVEKDLPSVAPGGCADHEEILVPDAPLGDPFNEGRGPGRG